MQLQVAYHHLFQEYDAHIKASLEGDKQSQVGDGPQGHRGEGGEGDTGTHGALEVLGGTLGTTRRRV